MSAGVVADLASIGYEVASVSELRNSGVRYREAVPVLLHWLPLVETDAEKEEIVRALSVPWAKEAIDPLIAQFSEESTDSTPRGELLRWAVGNALNVLWDDTRFIELSALARDSRFGMARQMVVMGFAKSKLPEATGVLLDLVNDPDVDGHAIWALAKMKAPQARSAFESKLEDKRPWVRKAAHRALTRLGVDL